MTTRYGLDGYGTTTYPAPVLDNLRRNWSYDFQYIDNGDPFYNYLSVFAHPLREISLVVGELYDSRFIESASGPELERIGREVGVTREANESDDAYRYRVALGKAIAASDGTADDIAAILSIAFDDDVVDAIEVTHVSGDPITRFTVSSAAFDDVPISRQRLEDRIETAFPCGHGVEVVTDDTWLLGQSGSQGIGNGCLVS